MKAFLGLQWLIAAHPKMIMGSKEKYKVSSMLSLSEYSVVAQVGTHYCESLPAVRASLVLLTSHDSACSVSFFCSVAPSVLQSHT